jgi:heme-degrading monooxygenase HmoA
MVVEYIRYSIPPEQAAEFEEAYGRAAKVLDESPQCISYELSKGVEEADHYILRIEWTSVEDHEQGFRQSSGFQQFFAAIRPFFDRIEEMKHYGRTAVASA